MRVLHVAAECHPLVKTGGLADVVHAHDSHAGLACACLKAQPGRRAKTVFTGHDLAFQGPWRVDLEAALQRALRCHAQPERWWALMRRAMAQDFSWRGAACHTLSLYDALRGARTEAGAARKSTAALP